MTRNSFWNKLQQTVICLLRATGGSNYRNHHELWCWRGDNVLAALMSVMVWPAWCLAWCAGDAVYSILSVGMPRLRRSNSLAVIFFPTETGKKACKSSNFSPVFQKIKWPCEDDRNQCGLSVSRMRNCRLEWTCLMILNRTIQSSPCDKYHYSSQLIRREDLCVSKKDSFGMVVDGG